MNFYFKFAWMRVINDYIPRSIETTVLQSIKHFPVVAITGPRQCGKSTLIKHLFPGSDNVVFLDLERPSDLAKLVDAEWFLSSQKGKKICIDEVQRRPEIFPIIRSLVDEWQLPGSFIILGSASRDLLRQSSETLAGRIVYKRLTPFLFSEIEKLYTLEDYFSSGGFPRSILADSAEISFEWRENFIQTFLERDLLQWSGFTPATMRRLWQMLGHVNGQTVNYSSLASSLGITSVTVKNYIDLLEATYMIEVILPYTSNLGKRLVKSPKIYISDSGITTALLGLKNFEAVSGHPCFGAIWEQIVLTNVKGHFPNADFLFYRTSNGAEVDFVMLINNKIFVIECKASYAPVLSKGNYHAIGDIAPLHTFIVIPSGEEWEMKEGISVVANNNLINKITSFL